MDILIINKSKTINSHYNGCKNLINLFKKILKISFKLEVVWNMEILDHRIMKVDFFKPKGNLWLSEV